MKLRGRCWKFGDNIPTDMITPIALLFKGLEEMARHVLEVANPAFPKQVQQGDLIVAGLNFGCSSGRAVAPKALKVAGVGGVVAESFSRTFYRNAHEVGLPILECAGISRGVQEGDVLELDLEAGLIRDERSGEVWHSRPCPPFLLNMLKAGGLIPLVEQQGLEW